MPNFDPPNMDDRQHAALRLLRAAGILPIVTVDSIELTLRTPVALAAISALKSEFPQLAIGAGTILNPEQIEAAVQAGADFLVTPGASPTMLAALARCPLPVVPGAATPSEMLALAERGFRVAKLFPAAVVGGIAMLKAVHAPLPELMFCPTGGIGEAEAADYLAQPNVACIGGSWMVPRAWLQGGQFEKVSESAARARAIIDAARGQAR